MYDEFFLQMQMINLLVYIQKNVKAKMFPSNDRFDIAPIERGIGR
jgi:hypothetical protein